ncbi:DUF3035 domain-containing protein [Ferrovibrio sp.]|uniref:DUF3035 domain-containing protein n=1 Tax=Ferrovibrio sp. TaxID=1917215 RepID=UPI0025BB9E09|nr:DUF3035 domain-containing protein [Ferrovibrio sp.]MBX3454622.1 DUF3035 domain-containing protein [Ferrovibrio sp.]
MTRPNRAARPSAILALLLASPLALAGCDSAREMAGLNKKAPDEFAVVTKAPLVMPPEFGLRPPEPGATRPQEVSARERAQAALASGGRGEAAGQLGPLARNAPQQQVQRSAGEQVLLQQARATNADPDIRRKVNEEFTQLAERDSSFVNRLVNWQNNPDPTATVVDPAREQQRLRENTARGESPTKGDVPTIKRRERGLLEGLF